MEEPHPGHTLGRMIRKVRSEDDRQTRVPWEPAEVEALLEACRTDRFAKRRPWLYSLVVTRARPAERGMAMAIFTGLFDVGTLAGGPTLGLIIATRGYATMFGTAAVLLVAGSIVFARWDRGHGSR